MLRKLLALCLIFSFSNASLAKPADEFPELLSSRQLLALTPARRVAYMTKIRQMMVELSAMSARHKGSFVAINDIEPGRIEQLINLLVPPAFAAQCNDPTYPIDLGGVCARPCMVGAPQSAAEQAQAVNNVSFCFKAPLASRSVRNDLSFNSGGFDTNRPFSEIAPKLEALTNSRAQEIKRRISSPPLAVGTPPLGAHEKTLVGADNSPSGRNTAAEARQAARAAQLTVGTQPPGPGETRTAGLPDSPSGPSTRRQCKTEGHVYSRFSDTCVEESIYKNQLAENNQEKKDGITAEQIVATSGNGTPCKAPTIVCSDKESYRNKGDREKALEEFRKGAPSTCVYAGNMSTYANQKVEANNCAKVSEFCISKSKETCDKPSPERYGNDFQLKYKCGSGKTLCSPFIFGLERPNKAICVPAKGKFVTEACDAAARSAEGKQDSTYVKDFVGRAPTGVAEAWDEYAEAFNKTCRDNVKSMNAHCEECKIIGQRLKEANLVATGSCESAVKYHERSGKPAESTTTK